MRMRKKARSAALHNDHRDPFECLPEHILHYILSLLPSNKDRARTTLVSKLLRNAYSSHPRFGFDLVMDFDVKDFLPEDMKYSSWLHSPQHHRLRELNDQFLSFVDEALARDCERSLRIRSFKICGKLIEIKGSWDLLDKWIGMALDNGAWQLHLQFEKACTDCSYTVPARVFSSASIKTLTLHGQELTTPLGSLNTTVNLTSLQSLKFYWTPLDEPMLQKLLRGCPLLEELTLSGCEPLTQVVISGPSKLRSVSLEGHIKQVEMEAQSLEEFNYSGTGIGFGERADVVFLMDRCRKLKHLGLKFCTLTTIHLQELISKFPLLENLSIMYCRSLEQIRILNPLLKRVQLLQCKGLVNVEMEAPSLVEFDYSGTSFGERDDVVFVMDRCRKLKHFKFRYCTVTQMLFQELISKFPLLESLSIHYCRSLEKIRISNPLLRSIELLECEGLVNVEIGSANLSFLRYQIRNKEQLPCITMLNPTTCISNFEASLTWDGRSIPNADWFVQLGKFLFRSCTFRSLSVDLYSWQEGDVKSTEYPLPSLPFEIDQLNLRIRVPGSCYASILNRLLSVCHPTTLRVSPDNHGSEFLQFLCKKLENRGDDDTKCWLHELRRVEIEGIKYRDYEGPLEWSALSELVPTLDIHNRVCFKLHWV